MSKYSQKVHRVLARRLDPNDNYAYDSISLEAKSLTGGGGTKYAKLAMQQVPKRTTEITIEQGERVKNQLSNRLSNAGFSVGFEYQGSVPMNVHIKSVHDIDLLVLGLGYCVVDMNGPKANTYTDLHGDNVITRLYKLRKQCELDLSRAFPQAVVATNGSKSIAISGGSLSRKVDVVPACWYDSVRYQAENNSKIYRGVNILDTSNYQLITNYPFLVRHKIDEADHLTNGGAKRVVRLLKTLKEDADNPINLSSFDIVSLVTRFNLTSIIRKYGYDLALVLGAQIEINRIHANDFLQATLRTSDETRLIFDSEDKKHALTRLKSDLDDLVREITLELNTSSLGNQHHILNEHYDGYQFR